MLSFRIGCFVCYIMYSNGNSGDLIIIFLIIYMCFYGLFFWLGENIVRIIVMDGIEGFVRG